jgi:predicted metalloprotease with PDZ domain
MPTGQEKASMITRLLLGLAIALSAPLSAETTPPIPEARDAAYPGTMMLAVDATDIDRRIINVKQSIPVTAAGPMVLLFPEWLPGNHAPRGQIEKLAGLTILAGEDKLNWKRDPVDVYAFHIQVPQGTRKLDVTFQFVSATEPDQGRVVVTDAMMNVQWQSVSLYPAGWKTSRIPVRASLTLPAGWRAATALRPQGSTASNTITYATVDYETLIDSPVFAGKYFRAEPLAPNVTLNIVADDAKSLTPKPQHIDAHKRLVDQAFKLFGSRPFDHYDFLLALTDELGGIGLEHHRSSENSVNLEYFTEWESGPGRRNLLPHELAHAWVGKYRRPAGQIVPDFRTPLINDLLWVYEGQDQFWGYVLGARSGMFTKQETLDAIALIAANLDVRSGRNWRPVEDTTRDPIITARRPKGWVTYQRSEDYYNEGMLIWLEADAIMRARSGRTLGLDDFAKRFFAGKDGEYKAVPFTLDDIVRDMNAVVPLDWKQFLTSKIGERATPTPISALELSGYRLAMVEEPTPFFKDAEKRAGEVNLAFSLGLVIGKNGHVAQVVWDGPAFKAGLTNAAEIVAVNGRTYSDSAIRDAVTAAKNGTEPIRLIVKSGSRVREVAIPYSAGHRYPRLTQMGGVEGSLDLLLKPR